MRIPLLSGAYEGISTNTSSQEAINFYYEPPSPGEQHQGAMVPTHGATLFDTLDAAANRAMLFDPGDSLLYVVNGDSFYELTSGAVATDKDTLATSTGRCELALNPLSREILIVDGSQGIGYDIATDTGTNIADADFPDSSNTCAYVNGRFLVNDTTVAGKCWFSDINDVTGWGAASFVTAQSLTSPIRKIVVDKVDAIYLFGDDKSEVFYNSGDPDLVFEKVEAIETGIAAGQAACLFDNSVAWLTRSERGALHVARAGKGFQPEIISTPEMSFKFERYSTVSDAVMYSLIIDGYEFLDLHFPTAGTTWRYSARTKLWSQLSGAFSGGEPTRLPVSCAAFAGSWSGGTQLFGSSAADGKIFALSTSVYTWDSVQQNRRLTGPMFSSPNEDRIRLSEVTLDCERGVLDAADAGTQRTVTLNWSKDGGNSFGTGVSFDLGEAADDEDRLVVRKLGKARRWIFRVATATNRRIVIKGLIGKSPDLPENISQAA